MIKNMWQFFHCHNLPSLPNAFPPLYHNIKYNLYNKTFKHKYIYKNAHPYWKLEEKSWKRSERKKMLKGIRQKWWIKSCCQLMNPNSGTKVLHNLHVQSDGFQPLIFALNDIRESESFMFSGTMSQIFGPLNLIVSVP